MRVFKASPIAVVCTILLTTGMSAGLASPTTAPPLCSGLGSIRPGSGVGSVSLNMLVSDAGRALHARPQQSVTAAPTPGRIFFGFWTPGAVESLPLRVIAVNGRIAGITLDASGATLQCQFDSGIGIASNRGEILRALGTPDVRPDGLTAQWLIYDRLGVMFALGTLGNPDPPESTPVTSLDIFAPNHLCAVYRERCASYKFDVP